MVALLPVIEKILEAGMSHREIEDELELKGDRPVHNLLKRQKKSSQRCTIVSWPETSKDLTGVQI